MVYYPKQTKENYIRGSNFSSPAGPDGAIPCWNFFCSSCCTAWWVGKIWKYCWLFRSYCRSLVKHNKLNFFSPRRLSYHTLGHWGRMTTIWCHTENQSREQQVNWALRQSPLLVIGTNIKVLSSCGSSSALPPACVKIAIIFIHIQLFLW